MVVVVMVGDEKDRAADVYTAEAVNFRERHEGRAGQRHQQMASLQCGRHSQKYRPDNQQGTSVVKNSVKQLYSVMQRLKGDTSVAHHKQICGIVHRVTHGLNVAESPGRFVSEPELVLRVQNVLGRISTGEIGTSMMNVERGEDASWRR